MFRLKSDGTVCELVRQPVHTKLKIINFSKFNASMLFGRFCAPDKYTPNFYNKIEKCILFIHLVHSSYVILL